MERSEKNSSSMRFLSFSNDQEDAEKKAKLQEAAAKIEEAVARRKNLDELVDYKPTADSHDQIDPEQDTRPLFERLMEQKNKKKEEIEESQKLSNLVTSLDEDDAQYLNEVARRTQEEEIKKRLQIYDALEEKKRLLQKKQLESEKELKESLLNSKLPTKSSTLKHKLLPLIKVKPKQAKAESSSTNLTQSSPNSAGRASQRHEKQQADDSNQCNTKEETSDLMGSDQSAKRQKVESTMSSKGEAEKDEKPASICGNDAEKDQVDGSTNVMKCIGVLPSWPIVRETDNSDDSDNSDEEMNRRMVPQVGRRK